MAEGTAHEGKIRRVKRILYPLVKIIAYAGSSAEGYPKEIKIFFFLFLIDKSGFMEEYMNWINFYGLAFMLVIMIPNIIFASINKDGFQNLWKNKFVEVLEQIGRMGCFGFMVFIIPRCGFGFSPDESFSLYLIVNVVLLAAYCLIWIICFKRNSIFRALALSIIPSVIFLASGILSRYIPLIVAAVIFAPCHIAISYKNVELETKR